LGIAAAPQDRRPRAAKGSEEFGDGEVSGPNLNNLITKNVTGKRWKITPTPFEKLLVIS
jgi:hypothetical protein